MRTYKLLNVIDFEILQSDKPEIVQVGISVVNLELHEIVKKTGFFVKPVRKEYYNEDFFQLTGISQRSIIKGHSLKEAVKILSVKYGLSSRPFVCFGRDWKQILDECADKGLKIEIKHIFDIALYLNLINKTEKKISLAYALKKYDIEFEGRPHNAESDAFNTAKLFLKLMK
jgi:inhibitor of KinA sporulation pathway (predicted exonuclease)